MAPTAVQTEPTNDVETPSPTQQIKAAIQKPFTASDTVGNGHSNGNGEAAKKNLQANAKPMQRPLQPVYADVASERKHKLERLALAFRTFARLGYDDGVAGHLTLRDPEHSDQFWVNPFGVPFAHMNVSDLLLLDHEGNIIGGGTPECQMYNRAAFAIHARIHMARPDVNAACHSHSIYGKAFSTLGKNIDIITQDSCVFYNDCALYPNFGGPVLDVEEGDNIAKYLGNKKAIILQNHGILTVAKTIESATAWFIQLEHACQVQLLAEAAAAGTGGSTVKIPDEEAEFTYKTIGGDGWFWAQPFFAVTDRECKGEYKS